jgi:hypothetical protein
VGADGGGAHQDDLDPVGGEDQEAGHVVGVGGGPAPSTTTSKVRPDDVMDGVFRSNPRL